MKKFLSMLSLSLLLASSVPTAMSGEFTADMKKGTPDLQSIGPITFGSDGVLFISDPKAGAIFAVATADTGTNPNNGEFNVAEVDKKVAALLGTSADNVLINDLAVNTVSGNAYLSVSRGRGPEAAPLVVKVNRDGKVEEFSLADVNFAKTVLPNPAEPAETRRGNPRMESITDMEFVGGKLYVAGLSSEEFASNFRVVSFSGDDAERGSSVEIYHGAHGQFETRSPIRTFVPYEIDGEPYILAAYTCTPLVKIPVSELIKEKKVTGSTVAELGNRNRPLDMVVYNKDNKDYILMANSSRGMMKITTDKIDSIDSITEKIDGIAGLPYETVADMQGVVQLSRLDDNHALILVMNDQEGYDLETMFLP